MKRTGRKKILRAQCREENQESGAKTAGQDLQGGNKLEVPSRHYGSRPPGSASVVMGVCRRVRERYREF